MPSNIFSDSAKQIFRQPGHTIYLLPTVVICNLLPCELDFYVKGMPINGTLKPGKEAALPTADTSQNIELGKAGLATFIVTPWKIPGSILWAFWAPWRKKVTWDISVNWLRAKDFAMQQSTEPLSLCVGMGVIASFQLCVCLAVEWEEANVRSQALYLCPHVILIAARIWPIWLMQRSKLQCLLLLTFLL